VIVRYDVIQTRHGSIGSRLSVAAGSSGVLSLPAAFPGKALVEAGDLELELGDGVLGGDDGRLAAVRGEFHEELGLEGVGDPVAGKGDGFVAVELRAHEVADGVVLAEDDKRAGVGQPGVLLEVYLQAVRVDDESLVAVYLVGE